MSNHEGTDRQHLVLFLLGPEACHGGGDGSDAGREPGGEQGNREGLGHLPGMLD